MTTIAYRDGMIAADTATHWGGGVMQYDAHKIARNDAGDLAGAAGHNAAPYQFLEWFKGGEKGGRPEAGKDEDGNSNLSGIIVRTDGSIWLYDSDGVEQLYSEYVAIGSGKAVALGALYAGADAATAVMAAITHDSVTGGETETLEHEK